MDTPVYWGTSQVVIRPTFLFFLVVGSILLYVFSRSVQ